MDHNRRSKAKLLYWNYFKENKKYWGNGFTQKRLDKIASQVLCDGDFWDDILIRHGGIDFSPNALRKFNKDTYDHCMGNMTGMIMQRFVEFKIIKP